MKTTNHFYSRIVSFDTLILALNQLDLTDQEKEHLLTIADSSLYHTVLDAILSELSSEDKKVFLMHLAHDDHDKIWEFLNNKIENIETKIKLTADNLTEKLHKDIKDVKRSS